MQPLTEDDIARMGQDYARRVRTGAVLQSAQPVDAPQFRRDAALSRAGGVSHTPLGWNDDLRSIAQIRARQADTSAALNRAPALATYLGDGRGYSLAADDLGPLSAVLNAIERRGLSQIRVGSASVQVGAARQNMDQEFRRRVRELLPNDPLRVITQFANNVTVKTLEGIAGLATAAVEQAEYVAPEFITRHVLEPVAGYSRNVSEYNRQAYVPFRTGSQDADAAIQGVESIPLSLLALVTAARGNPGAGIGMLSSVTGGQSYAEGRREGMTPIQALSYGTTMGSFEALGEALPVFHFAGDIARGSGLFRTLRRQFVAENLGEQFTQHSQDFTRWAQIEANQGKTFADFVRERPRVIRDTFIATTTAVGLQTAGARGFTRALERYAVATEAQADARNIDRIMAAAAESRLRRESPADFQELLEQQFESTANDSVYIPAERVRSLFQSAEDMSEDPFWGRYADEIHEAVALGGDVVIPISEIATHLPGTPQWETLKDHSRTSAGGVSRAEAVDVDAAFAETLREQAELLASDLAATDAPTTKVFEAMRDKLIAAGFLPDVANQLATQFTQRQATRAARLGRELSGQEADAVDVRSGDEAARDGRSLEQSTALKAALAGALAMGSVPAVGGMDSHTTSAVSQAPAQDWQARYARPDWRDTLTTLDSTQEAEFQRWAQANNIPLTDDYDMRGFWLHGGSTEINQNDGARHFPDTYKTPLHQSFSGESVYADPSTDPPTWNDRDQLVAADGTVLFDERVPRSFDQIQRGRITFTSDGKATIDLFEARDLSTFIHESGHLYLEELRADAGLALELDTPEGRQLFADWETVKAWFAREGHPVAADGTISTEAHELFARGFERFAMEGKAPSSALRRAFEAFRSWLINIYKTVAQLKAPITPEIRDVMNRMLATDEEIVAAAEEQRIKLGFETAEQAGMTEKEFAAYREAAVEATNEAHTELLRRVMATIRAGRTKEYRSQEADARAEVTAAIDEQPVFRALRLLRTGRLGDEDARVVKLDRQFLIDTYGSLDLLPKSVPPIYGDASTFHPDVIAEEVGFASGDEMIRALMDHEAARKELKAKGDKRSPRKAAIDEATAQNVSERYGDPLNDGTIEQEARALIHNDKQGEVFATELRALARQTDRRPTPYSLAKAWAAEKIAAGKVVDVASGAALQQYQRAARRAAKAFEEALLTGDRNEAFKQKHAQMLNNALISEAKKAKDRIDVAVRRLGKVARRRTSKSTDQAYLEQAQALLAQVELGQRSQDSIDAQESFEAFAAEQANLGIDMVVPPSFAASLGKTHWSRLSVEQLIGLDETVQQILHLGRNAQSVLDGMERRALKEAKDELEASADGAGRGRKVSALNDPSRSLPQRAKSKLRWADAAMLKIETLCDWLDGGKSNGPWNRLIFKQMADAQGLEGDLMRSYVERINALIKAVPRKQARDWGRDVNTPELVNKVSPDPALRGQPFIFGKDQVILMALNMGNAGNIQRLLDGYGWNEQQMRTVLDRLMTEQDWQFVQGVWDALEGLKTPLFEMERRVNGVEPETVEAVAVDTPFGTMRGGYFPAVYDPQYFTPDQIEEVSKGKFSRASTRSSATKERAAKVKRPILLSMSVITNHMREVIHDITHREAVIQVSKILASTQIRNAVDRALGPEYMAAMDGWLEDVARPNAQSGNRIQRLIESVGRWLHKSVTLTGLGFRASTVIIQPLGIANIKGIIGERAVLEGMATFLAGQRGGGSGRDGASWVARNVSHNVVYDEVVSRSAEMRDRFSTMDASIADMWQQHGSRLRAIGPRGLAKYAFHGILFADLLITTGGWIGAFNKGLREGMTEEDATYYADKVIRTSQGSGAPKDRAAILRASKFVGAFIPFFTYLNAHYNQQRDIGRRVRNTESVSHAAETARRAWWIMIVPGLLMALVRGDGPDEDDEESWAAYLAKAVMIDNLSTLPGVGALANAVGNGWGYRATAVQSSGEGIVRAIGDIKAIAFDPNGEHEPSKSWIKNMFTAIGFLTGQPLSAPGAAVQFLADVREGDAEPGGLDEWYEGLTTGRVRED